VAQDIIDAEFISISPGEAARAAVERTAKAKIAAGENSGDDQIAFLKAAQTPKRPPAVAQAGYVVFVTLAAMAAFLVSGGHVLFTGRTASPPPAALTLELLDHPFGAKPIRGDAVSVSAAIHNNGGTEKTVPDVLLTFQSEGDNPALIYRVPRGETLKPGKSLAFTVRMPKKPGYGQAPGLRFDNNGV
jgi:hypothetical protein